MLVRQLWCPPRADTALRSAWKTSQRRWQSTPARDYAAAVQSLNTLQSNFAVVDAIRKSGRGMNQNAIPEMIEWVKRIGYEPPDFDRLNAVHVAGTKGKGSTSAFVSSILQQYRGTLHGPSKVGLYTSPHLRFVRERIQIDGQPLSEVDFARYFFDVWDRLEASATAEGHPNPTSAETKPVYFRFLTLMAFHCYLTENVDAAVIECGIGGEYDSTNIIIRPSVTVVTSLGIDHSAMLGDTIESIAWHKAGVFKPNVPALSAPQPEAALDVLEQRAAERHTKLQIVRPKAALEHVKLGLAADFQQVNAAVAVAAAAAHLSSRGHLHVPDMKEEHILLPEQFKRGLEEARLGGRCEIRSERDGALVWHIDGGHTLESIELAARWFSTELSSARSDSKIGPTILIFNQQSRDAASLARRLHSTLEIALGKRTPFTHAIFCTNTTYKETGFRPDLTSINNNDSDVAQLSVQNSLAHTWAEIDHNTNVSVLRTIEEAVDRARSIQEESRSRGVDGSARALVTGSLHLVGGLLEVLESESQTKV